MKRQFLAACQLIAVTASVLACNTTDPEFNAPIFAAKIPFSAQRLYPEGITYAPSLGKFLVSSLTQGKIGTVSPNGQYEDFIADKQLINAVGIKVREGKLYICNGDLGVSGKSTDKTTLKTAGLFVVDLANAQLIRSVRLDSLNPGVNHFANDVAFDRQGNAYVTDSFAPVIYKVTTDFKVSEFAKDTLFTGKQGFNLNGIVYHPDNFLLVVKSNEGKLFKVDVQNPNKVTEVVGINLPGGDGMVLVNDDLYVVNGQKQVSLVRSADGWKTAAVVKTDAAGYDQATTNVEVGGRVYTLNARIGEVNTAVLAKNPSQLQASEYSIEQFK